MPTYLKLVAVLQGMTNMELQFQMAIRDQIIHDQREALSNLWLVLECSGLNHEQIMEIAAQQGIMIEEGIMPVVAGRTHIPSTPIPILHKQPALTSGLKSPALSQLQSCADVCSNAENDKCQSQLRQDNDDSATCSSMTPDDEWKSPSSQGYGGYSQAAESHCRMFKNSSEMLRVDGVGLGHSNGDTMKSFSSKKLRGSKTPSLVDSNGCLGLLNTVGQDQSSSKVNGDGFLSPAFMAPKLLTHSRSRRRPRSAESRHQRRWTRDGYDTTTGSEGSEVETYSHNWQESQARPQLDRVKEGTQQPLDNELLRMVRF